MQLDDLVRAYQAKTDEELLHLADAPHQLTPEATHVLHSELAKRRIKPDVQNDGEPEKAKVEGKTTQSLVESPPAAPRSLSVREFLADVLRFYHDHFWFFVKLTLPAVFVGWAAILLARHEGREIARHLPRGIKILEHEREVREIVAINFAGFLVSWMGFCVSFGAICSVSNEIARGAVAHASQAFTAVRNRLVPFIRLSLLLFALLLVAEGAAELLASAILWVLRYHEPHLSGRTIWIVSYGSAVAPLLALSRFALAMPAVIVDNRKVGRAMFLSDELTEGKLLILAILLLKSLLGGYLVGIAPFWLAAWISQTIPLPSWFQWPLAAVSILAVSAVEPTMFIGFALLYLRMTAIPQSPEQAYSIR